MSPIRREERILNLLSALLAARAPLPFSEIRKKVSGYDDPASEDALDKRFDRDKGDLRALGVPLEYVPEDEFGRAGYRISKERFFLREIRFTTEEGMVLAALERTLAPAPADPYLSRLRSALAKIGVDSPLSEAFRESVSELHGLDPRASGAEPGPPPELGEALAARRRVRFRYYTLRSDEERERVVEPWGIGYSRGHWYLVGRDVESGERTFRTTRIRGGVEVLADGGYEIPEAFDLRESVNRATWELGGGKPVRVRIRFEPDVAWMIAENLRGGQEFEDDDDGGGVLTVDATDLDALVAWVAQYGPAAKVLSPRKVRERMVAHLREVAG